MINAIKGIWKFPYRNLCVGLLWAGWEADFGAQEPHLDEQLATDSAARSASDHLPLSAQESHHPQDQKHSILQELFSTA